MKWLVAFILTIIAPSVLAAPSFFDSPPTDESLTMLGNIFGLVGTLQLGLGAGGALVGKMFQVFNGVVITLGAIVLLYVLVVSTINTAQEGEVLGRRWSSIWIPIRSVLGIALMIPTATGYSIIQVLFMWIVVQGAGAANTMWGTVLDFFSQTGSVSQQIDPNIIDFTGFLDSVTQAYTCLRAVNEFVPNLTVNAYLTSAGNTRYINFGKEGNPNYSVVCGQIAFPRVPNDANGTSIQNAKINGVSAMGTTVSNIAELIVTSNPTPTNPPAGLKDAVRQAYVGSLAGVLSGSGGNRDWIDQSRSRGWAFAGSFYFFLTQSSQVVASQEVRSVPVFTVQPTSGIGLLRPNETALVSDKILSASSYINSAGNAGSIGDFNLSFQQNNGLRGAGKVEEFFRNRFTGRVGSLILDTLIGIIHGNRTPQQILAGNPIADIRTVASIALASLELLWLAGAAAIFFIMLVAAVGSCANSTGYAVQAAANWLTVLAVGIIGVLWGVLATLAFYVPIIPFIVFLLGVVGWIVGVVETIVAAPLVALGLITPAQDELGRIAHALMLVVNIFLRPTLMIIGFVISIFAVRVFIYLLNITFGATFNASGGNLTLFGGVAVISIYTGMLLVVVHRAFSLIHVVPDKVLRWIGGQQEQFGEAEGLQETKQRAERGAQTGEQFSSGAARSVSSLGERAGGYLGGKMGSGGASVTGK